MGDKLTPMQQLAVTDRGGRLLVSAAAGSGKTKVLVDRILSYLKDGEDPANLGDFLIITYTKAAAAELRGKIAAKLAEEISENPNNSHLRRQVQRLYLAKISTVHAFCGDILREYAYQLDISADFHVAEENVCLELQLAVIEQLLNHAYENAQNDPDFYAFVDSQGFGRNDRQLPEIILQTYNSARCHMDPEGWLNWCLQVCDVSNVCDVSETVWGKYLIQDLQEYLTLHIDAMRNCAEKASTAEGMQKPVQLLYATIQQLEALRKCQKWDEINKNMSVDFGKLTFPRKDLDEEMASKIKAVREACKKGVQKKLRRFFGSSAELLKDIQNISAAARGLINLTRQFSADYDRLKKRKRIMDFSDLEHKTLDLLLGKKRLGRTTVATEIARRFREVMVDEYQDSNEVQDAIFSAITEERKNCFMVGDVKQSIYQFRLADPGIFLEKYNRYVPAGKAVPGEGRKVLLSSNFRSAKSVIHAVNDVFSACMSKKAGGLVYGEDEMLNEGIPHAVVDEPEVELYGIGVKEASYLEEAEFVANRIVQLLDGSHFVREGQDLRPIRPEDIAILLRSPGSIGNYYIQSLAAKGIRCCTGNSTNLLETEEVETLRALLQIIDNPQQDIPLLAVLTSKVFGFTADDLAAFRSAQRHGSIYDALRNDCSEKAKNFMSLFCVLREKARENTLTRLLKDIFTLTKLDSIFASLPDGQVRQDNLTNFYQFVADYDLGGTRSLGQFLKHLDALDERGLATTGEQSATGAVTLMSIHKSKGLEFPVVFLPSLSRSFNNESVYTQMLCDKDIGLGLSCVDSARRVRYPSIAKRAISAKMLAESLSEELRVLYVAMTRAKDRLIMTYASKNLEKELLDIALRVEFSNPVLLTSEADCPGKWILFSAMQRTEAGAFFAISAKPDQTYLRETEWKIQTVFDLDTSNTPEIAETELLSPVSQAMLQRMQTHLSYEYPYLSATVTPSKQTATQLKGREKDIEAAEHTKHNYSYLDNFRKPSFIAKGKSGVKRGNALHTVMQYIRYEKCADQDGVISEIDRLIHEGYLSCEDAQLVEAGQIASFFASELGKKLMVCTDVLREFKFSVLDDAGCYDATVVGEQILLQGVVDCALVEADGITIVDFKTDRVTSETLAGTVEHYRPQVEAYGRALTRIYQKPIKSIMLYFFSLNQLIPM